ncbi:unnamed protein product [Bursaphelenchus xylophilus]|uniref:(pine wood nematode) hypothetical protein n=1 Tax=Bursaphelenchus xylophilus TaxID=6326 RepID=A0A1I7S5M2_BURXY|nr:unnamed protein product [Bursaphelenchus xylophilus]CAG9124863.1 unnamed protein product [Bursaphelenchus xylophilus]
MAYIQRRKNENGPRRRDVKERTMNRFAALDADIASRYDFEDEDERSLPINVNNRAAVRLVRGGGAALVRNRQLARQSGGTGRRDTIFQITVRNQGRGGIQFVAQALSEHVSGFLPFMFDLDSCKNVTFFVLTEEESDNIKVLSRRLTYPPGSNQKFLIYSKQCNAPWESLPANLRQHIKRVVDSRFNKAANSIDLSEFQHDKVFIQNDVGNLVSLTRNAVMVEVIKIINEHYNGISGLSLKGNRLSMLDTAMSLTFAAPGIVELDLSNNQIKAVEQLDKLRKWGVERLHLENNPFTSEYADGSSYTSAIHDYFPRVSYLDGTVVHCNPYKINADLQRRAGVPYPPVQPGFAPDQALKQAVEQFLAQFFELYDDPQPSRSRQNLIHAYDDNAVFTHCIQMIPDNRPVPKGDEEAFRQYIRSSHNIVHEAKWEKYREKVIYCGSMEIAVALSRLPVTQHLKDSFMLDFVFISNALMVFTIRGIFVDGEDVTKPASEKDFKFFNRTMAVVPKGEGKMAVVNDQLSISPVTTDRVERYNRLIKKAMEAPSDPQPNSLDLNQLNVNSVQQPGPSGLQNLKVEPQPAQQAPPPTPDYDVNDPNIREQMIVAFCQQSGMNREWSQKCLEELAWNFEAAGNAFNQSRAQIPPEAFQQ